MKPPHVYDKSKYHYDSIEENGLPEEHASNHTVFFLRWLIENSMIEDGLAKEEEQALSQFGRGTMGIHEVYERWDCCLIDDMLTEEGNAFSMHYFDFKEGQYIHDYIRFLQGSLPTEFHVEYNEPNYQKMKKVIDKRYRKFTGAKKPWWWF